MAFLEQCDWCRKIIKQYTAKELRDKGVNREETICPACQKKLENLDKILADLNAKIANRIQTVVGEARDLLGQAVKKIAEEKGDASR